MEEERVLLKKAWTAKRLPCTTCHVEAPAAILVTYLTVFGKDLIIVTASTPHTSRSWAAFKNIFLSASSLAWASIAARFSCFFSFWCSLCSPFASSATSLARVYLYTRKNTESKCFMIRESLYSVYEEGPSVYLPRCTRSPSYRGRLWKRQMGTFALRGANPNMHQRRKN